jgi:hypothetical protein
MENSHFYLKKYLGHIKIKTTLSMRVGCVQIAQFQIVTGQKTACCSNQIQITDL